ncbi:MAG: DUF1629 domain-containing protein [Oleispira sp.]
MEQYQRIARLQSPGLYQEWNYEEIRLVKNPDLDIPMIQPYELESRFVTINDRESEAPTKELLAPDLGDWHMKIKLIIKKKNPVVFDFYQYGDFLIVSSKVKKVFEDEDPLSHQYSPIELLDKKGNSIVDMQYYLMSVKRYVEVVGEYPEMPNDKLISQMSKRERKVRSALVNNPEVRGELVDFPLWKLPIERMTIFMSLKMLQALRRAGCTGLNDYKVEERHKGSPVSYV